MPHFMRHLSALEMADEERRRILSELQGDFTEDERRCVLLHLEHFVEGAVRVRVREERQNERLRLISLLHERSRVLGVSAVLPDDDDPLVTSDPTPVSDYLYPMSSEEYLEDWFQSMIYP
jgi:hypothetical protein